MNQLPARSEPKMMLLDYMADRYSLQPQEFSKTVRATCGLVQATAEQFAAFLIVAKQYNLNPITKEIYAFPGKGGGVVPIVSIDGWVNLVNAHGQCDGFEFDMEHDDKGALIACTCKMYRKDRKHPVIVTEYLSECKRSTEPWKMEHRMLRHKSLIQAARYAFGFAGVYDEDEARNIIENEPRDVTPVRIPSPSEIEHTEDHGSDKYRPGDEVSLTGEQVSPPPAGAEKPKRRAAPKKDEKPRDLPDILKDYDGFVNRALDLMRKFDDGGALSSWWDYEIAPFEKGILPPDWTDLVAAQDARQAALSGDGE